jgi:hypothetical protein
MAIPISFLFGASSPYLELLGYLVLIGGIQGEENEKRGTYRGKM